MAIEDDYQDVLQNLEFSIIEYYRQQPDLIDAEVLNAIEALIRIYGAEAQGKTVSNRPLRGITKDVAERVKDICEFRLGRSPVVDEAGQPIDVEPITVEELVACLKRIQSSIKLWTKERGRQGYLNFVQEFLP